MIKTEDFRPQSIVVPMLISTGLVILVAAVVLGLNLQTDPKVHVLFESTMQLMLVFAVGASFYSLRNEKQKYMLAMLLALIGTFVLDLRHLIYSAEPFSDSFGVTLAIDGNSEHGWLAPRLYLALMLLLTLWHEQAERLLKKMRVSTAAFYIAVAFGMIFVSDAVAVRTTELWSGKPGWLMQHPEELLPGVLYLLAVAGYIHAGRWKQSVFEVYLICGLLVSAISHLFVMPFSQQVFDSYYATAHFLKFVSYVVFLAGLITRSRDSARELLAEERQRSQSILEIVADGIFTLDSKNIVKNINRAGCDILGEPQEKMLGQDIKTWIPELDLYHGSLEAEEQKLTFNTPLELAGVRSDGATVPLEITFNVVNINDDEKMFVGVMRDISERQQHDMELRNLALQLETALDAAGLGSWEWDAATDKLTWDRQSSRIFGLAAPRGKLEVTREEARHMVHPDDQESAEDLFAGSDDEMRFRDQEYRILRGTDGAVRWISSSGAMRFDDNDELLSVVGVQRDVTQHKEDIEQLTAAREEAQEASRVKSAFLANMSHEIRTPMNGVIGMLDVLQQSSLNPRQMKMSQLIKDSSLSLLNLIDDILDFSKIEAGKLKIVEQPMCLEALAESVAASLDFLARDSGVEFALFVDPALPPAVMGDAHRIRQVLINLVNNAIKFSVEEEHTGKVALRAQLIEQQAEQLTVEFRVTDNGIGMDEDTQRAVFESFVQGDDSTQRRFGGTGLGLAITQSLVRMMGGHLQLHSTPGEGSEFSVQLTLAVTGAGSETEPAAARTTANLAGVACLLIEDPNGGSDDLVTYLTGAGAEVQLAANVTEASDWPGWQQTSGSVCLIDRGCQPFSAGNLELLKQSQATVVLINRSRDEQIVPFEPDVRVEGNAQGRHDLLQSVAIAARKMEVPPDDTPVRDVPDNATVPGREEAIAQNRLILIVEDNSINQSVIVAQLTQLGYSADVTENGVAGLEAWRTGNYGLILTDLEMPEMDGYELAVQIRSAESNGQRIPIIALSASAIMGEPERCEAVGMDGFLSKPARLTNMQAELGKWLPPVDAQDKRGSSDASDDPDGATKPVQLQVLAELVGGQTALIDDLLQEYRVNTATIRDHLVEAWRDGQLDKVGSHAHKLKSSSNAIGALLLGELCLEVEQAGKAYQGEALATLVPRLEAEINIVDDFIASM